MANNKHIYDMLKVLQATMMDEENDLTCSIVIAAYIEDHITSLIRWKMPGLNPALTSKLFTPDRGPLSSLSAKIDMACALGILAHENGDDARTIGTIRNRFAHNLLIDSFDHPKVSGLIANLKLPKNAKYGTVEGEPKSYDELTNRSRFLLAGISLCGSILAFQTPGMMEHFAQGPLPGKSGGPE